MLNKNNITTSKIANKVIVMDLECTCSKDQTSFPNDTTEIIEIGFCLYDTISKEITDKTSIIIKPDITKITEFCTSLTGITQEQVDTQGISLKDACQILITQWKSHNRMIACYGNDVSFINDECQKKRIITPFWNDKGFDVQILFKLKTGKRKKTGLSSGLEYFNFSFEGVKHSGADDAYNTAILLRELLK